MTQVATKPRPRARRRPPPAPTLDDVQHIVLEDVSWDFYERLLKEIGNRPIRVTYDEGRLEMMSPLPEHEVIKNLIHDMMRLLTMELDMPMKCLGSTTFRWQEKRGGMEPDVDYGTFIIPAVDGSLERTPVPVETGPLCTAESSPQRDMGLAYARWWMSP